MSNWRFSYTTESGFEGTLIVPGANRIMAFEMFDGIVKYFEDKVKVITQLVREDWG